MPINTSPEPDYDHYSDHPDGAREVGDGATCVMRTAISLSEQARENMTTKKGITNERKQ